jgi:hypothetical protein
MHRRLAWRVRAYPKRNKQAELRDERDDSPRIVPPEALFLYAQILAICRRQDREACERCDDAYVSLRIQFPTTSLRWSKK